MKDNRIETTEAFKKRLPGSGDALPVPMFTAGGHWHHMTIDLGDGHYAYISVPEKTVNERPEYFRFK